MTVTPRRRRLVLWPLAAALAGVLSGGVVGWLTAQAMLLTTDPQATFGDLAAYVVGLVVGVAVGVLVWLVGLARAARTLFAAGRRLGLLAASAGATFVVVSVAGVVAGGLSEALGDSPTGVLAAGVVFLTVPLAPVAVFLLWDRRAPAAAPDDAVLPRPRTDHPQP